MHMQNSEVSTASMYEEVANSLGFVQVRQHVYCAASPPLVSSTPLAALRQSPGVWTVYRHYVVDRGGTEFTLRQEWLVLCNPDARNGVKTLIAEVVSSLA